MRLPTVEVFDAKELLADLCVTVRVRGAKRAMFRARVAFALLWAAQKVAPFAVRIEEEPPE